MPAQTASAGDLVAHVISGATETITTSDLNPEARYQLGMDWDSSAGLLRVVVHEDVSPFELQHLTFDPDTSTWATVEQLDETPASTCSVGVLVDGSTLRYAFGDGGNDVWYNEIAIASANNIDKVTSVAWANIGDVGPTLKANIGKIAGVTV